MADCQKWTFYFDIVGVYKFYEPEYKDVWDWKSLINHEISQYERYEGLKIDLQEIIPRLLFILSFSTRWCGGGSRGVWTSSRDAWSRNQSKAGGSVLENKKWIF